MGLGALSCDADETYMDSLYGYKATFEAYISLTDKPGTAKLGLFQELLPELERALPCAEQYKRPDHIKRTHIKVVELLYSAGDVAGPMTLAFCLPNDEAVTAKHGTALVLQRNVSEAKFSAIVTPIAHALIQPRLRGYVTFDAFYTHTLCHECCHAIGPHDIADGLGGLTTVRARLQELHSALEEAKADAVGLCTRAAPTEPRGPRAGGPRARRWPACSPVACVLVARVLAGGPRAERV